MSEETRLKNLGLAPDTIWADENETVVYAQVLSVKPGRVLIFRFYTNPQNSPKSLSNRIVSCYHDIKVHHETLSFRDRATMRSAIWSSIATVWPCCAADPNVFVPGTVIDLSSDYNGGLIWCVYRSPLFDQYLGLLRHIQRSDLVPPTNSAPTIDISKIDLLERMGGRGCCKRAQVPPPFVFKGIDVATYLQLHDDDNEFMLVTIRDLNGDEILIGHLSTFSGVGDLASLIERANRFGAPIPLQEKAKWCHQMSLAVAHVPRVLHTFPMDIKPGNFLVDVGLDLLLIEWEQSGAPATTLAPEADGTWDVNEDPADGGGRLVYTKYTGPPRRNMPEGSGPVSFPVWNVFPEWQATFPRATELAEVFALGRTMWMLLTQTVGEFDNSLL